MNFFSELKAIHGTYNFGPVYNKSFWVCLRETSGVGGEKKSYFQFWKEKRDPLLLLVIDSPIFHKVDQSRFLVSRAFLLAFWSL